MKTILSSTYRVCKGRSIITRDPGPWDKPVTNAEKLKNHTKICHQGNVDQNCPACKELSK